MNDEYIKLKVKDVRLSKGISLSECARRTGMSKAYLSQLESGKFKNPSVLVLLKLSVVLGVSINDLIEDWQFTGRKTEKEILVEIFGPMSPPTPRQHDEKEESNVYFIHR